MSARFGATKDRVRTDVLIQSGRFADPIFALSVGMAGAAMRIRRDEEERYPGQTISYGSIAEKGRRMTRHYFGYDEKVV